MGNVDGAAGEVWVCDSWGQGVGVRCGYVIVVTGGGGQGVGGGMQGVGVGMAG